ncbi:MAG: HAMP domain-containing protein [Desulfobacterales bacterium]|nr:HAMP domain-containing protein [Desulfobacterales bacterium]
MPRKLFPLNISQKIVIISALGLMVALFIGGTSYQYLRTIRTKQVVVESVDDLSNIILELRRYEKNYLLYSAEEDLSENRRYARMASDMLASILRTSARLKIESELNRLMDSLMTYNEVMDAVAFCAAGTADLCGPLEDRLRESGKALVDISQSVVRLERQMILKSLISVEKNLIIAMVVVIFMGLFFSVFIAAKIVRPLRVIEKTTVRIAQGNFKPLQVIKSYDETQRVMEAFNRMMTELERRQEQLVQAKKLTSIGILASGIAHQLNNPLNNISTSLQILSEEFGQSHSEFFRQMLTNCGQEIVRAKEIVKGLLEFSREKDFALRPWKLQEVVAGAIRLISSQVPSGIEIATEVPPDLELNLDSQRMQEVFLNLLMNAIQAIEPMPGQVKITAEKVVAFDHKAFGQILVADTGKGIDAKDIGRIFDPFFTTKEVGSGTGLGLSIVYGIIEKHQGTISVESTPGVGTRFIICLPLAEPLKTVRGS